MRKCPLIRNKCGSHFNYKRTILYSYIVKFGVVKLFLCNYSRERLSIIVTELCVSHSLFYSQFVLLSLYIVDINTIYYCLMVQVTWALKCCLSRCFPFVQLLNDVLRLSYLVSQYSPHLLISIYMRMMCICTHVIISSNLCKTHDTTAN
jgi:hypothetical protein